MVDRSEIERALDGSVAVLMLTHVDYASGEIHDMRRITEAAQKVGTLVLWDLSHSTGAVPVDLNAAQVDLAVGCGYKYLNGGPGAPAYLFVAKGLQDAMQSPLSGWMGHAAPFAFEREYRAAPGINHQLAGSPAVLSMLALEVAVDLWLRVDRREARRKAEWDAVEPAAAAGLGTLTGRPAASSVGARCARRSLPHLTRWPEAERLI